MWVSVWQWTCKDYGEDDAMNELPDRRSRYRQAFSIMLVSVIIFMAISCSLSPKERANPLDPMNLTEPFQLTLQLVNVADETGTVRRIMLDWRDIDHVALKEYHIFRRAPVPIGPYSLVAVTQPPTTTFLDDESIVEEWYFYRVSALFGDGNDSVLSDRIEYRGDSDPRY